MTSPATRWFVALAVASVATLAWMATFACESGPADPERAPWVDTFDVRATELGPITYFARIRTTGPDDVTAEQLAEMLATFEQYGSPRATWVDQERTTLDLLAEGARFEYAGSFVQDALDLAETSDVPWRFRALRYRANYSARQVTFRLEGAVAADTTLEIDTGDGFHEVPIDDQGRYDVLVPFSHSRQVAFVRIDSGRQVRYGMIRLGEDGIRPLDEDGYREARRLAVEPRRGGIEIPVPDFGLDVESQTRPGDRQGDTVSDEPGATPPSGRRRERDEDGFAPMAPFPPKVLARQVPIEVHLVFDGLLEADPMIDELRNVLMPVGFKSDYYDAERELVWFTISLLDLEDIRRVHRLVETYAEETGLPLVCRSRFLAVEMELLPFAGTLRTTVRGRVPSGANFALYLPEEPGAIPERRQIEIDEQGRFAIEIQPQSEPILGMITENKEQVTYIELDPVSGNQTELSETQFQLELAAVHARAATNEQQPAPDTADQSNTDDD